MNTKATDNELVTLGYSKGYDGYRNKWIGDHEEMIADLVRDFVPRATLSEAKLSVDGEFAREVLKELRERAPSYSISSVERDSLDRAILAIQGLLRPAPLPVDAVHELALAAGALNVATDGEGALRPERLRVLAALAALSSPLPNHE